MPTEERRQAPGWWPTKGAPGREQYAGPEACASCHAGKTAAPVGTPMGHASMPAASSELLRSHQPLSFRAGPYIYQIERTMAGDVYSVTYGLHAISARLDWAFGLGEVGQTYIYERNGIVYESRLSYYKTLSGLDFTTGHSHREPANLETALGRPIDFAETRLCFGCHTTASMTSNRLDLNRLIPGVTCEACHGPGAAHVAAIRAGRVEAGRKLIFNPRGLKAVDSVEFCGACHRSFWDVVPSNENGVSTIRYQAYRLETSRCWDTRDARITCVACHDPHQPLVHDLQSFDARCLTCHRGHPGRACRVSTTDCARCHMPKYEIPEMHFKFTDHRIRIVRNHAPFPT